MTEGHTGETANDHDGNSLRRRVRRAFIVGAVCGGSILGLPLAASELMDRSVEGSSLDVGSTAPQNSFTLPLLEGFMARPLPFEAFVSKEPLPPGLENLLKNATLRVRTKITQCSGAMVNQYLVTASHCIQDGNEGADIAPNIADNYQTTHAKLSKWVVNRNTDVAVGIVSDVTMQLPGLHVGVFATEAPSRGSRAMIASLGGDTNKPLVAELVFLGERNDGKAKWWSYAVSPTSASIPCIKGASGSIVSDGRSSHSVLSSILDRRNHTDLWNGKNHSQLIDELGQERGVDLSSVNTICITAPLLMQNFNGHIEMLGPPS